MTDTPHDSTLFTIRLWQEQLNDDHTEWRGKVQHVVSGRSRYFRDWPALVEFLTAPTHDDEELAG